MVLLWAMMVVAMVAGCATAPPQAWFHAVPDGRSATADEVIALVDRTLRHMGYVPVESNPHAGSIAAERRVPNDPFGRSTSLRVTVVIGQSGDKDLRVEAKSCPGCIHDGPFAPQWIAQNFVAELHREAAIGPWHAGRGAPAGVVAGAQAAFGGPGQGILDRHGFEAPKATAPPRRQAESVVAPSVNAVHADRHALVIGNDNYAHIARLRNARADARAMARALEGAGFKVTLKTDLDEKAMTRAIRDFKSGIAGGDEAVFFYAGHGVQIGGGNYLLPVDLDGEDEAQVRDDAVSVQRIMDDLQERKSRFTLAIIDACRDNPFRGLGRSIGSRGLAPTNVADGQMIIFSAGAGQQALDRVGPDDRNPNGLFTRVFVKEIEKRGVAVHEALRNVRDEVVRQARGVNHAQTPAIYDQSTGSFYFRR